MNRRSSTIATRTGLLLAMIAGAQWFAVPSAPGVEARLVCTGGLEAEASGQDPFVRCVPASDLSPVAIDTAAGMETTRAIQTPMADDTGCAHDVGVYHGLEVDGCHYTHTHNANPYSAWAVRLFGLPGRYYGGLTVGLPWASEAHPLYKWDLGEARNGCELPSNLRGANCIARWRVHHHPGGAAPPNNVRFHSFWIEAEICTQDGAKCGILRTGGMADYGCLFGDYKKNTTTYIPLANDPEQLECGDNNIDAARAYRVMVRSDSQNFQKQLAAGLMSVGWVSDDINGWNQIVDFAYQANDGWGPVDPSDPSKLIMVCPGANCKFNHSNAGLYQINVRVPASLDDDGDGFVTYRGYTDLQGNLEDCTSLSADCIPLVLEDVPAGTAAWTMRSREQPYRFYLPEWDTSPPGTWWIEYPN